MTWGEKVSHFETRFYATFSQKRTVDRMILASLCVWVIIAIVRFSAAGHFFYDEALLWDEILALKKSFSFPVVGGSLSNTSPVAFNPGSSQKLILLIPFALGDYPVLGTIWMMILSSLSLFFLNVSLKKSDLSPVSRLSFSLLLTWSVWHFSLLDRMWQPYLMFSLLPFVLAFTFSYIYGQRSAWKAGGLGFTASVLCQCYLAAAPALVCLAIASLGLFLSKRSKVPLRHFVYLLLGGLIPYLPYFIWDSLSGFQNTRSIWNSVALGSESSSGDIFQNLKVLGFLSQSTSFREIATPPYLSPLASGFNIIVSVVTFLLFVGSLLRVPWRFVVFPVSALAMIVGWLGLNGRPFAYHYFIGFIPLLWLSVAVFLGKLFEGGVRQKRIVISFLTAFVATGYSFSDTFYADYSPGRSVPDQIQKTQALMKINSVIDAVRNPEFFTYWTIGKNLYHFNFEIKVPRISEPCAIRYGQVRQRMQFRIDNESFVQCR
jgi:hypothetical protein